MDLIENKDLFQAVFDSAPNGIAVMESVQDDNGKVNDFSILLFNSYTLNWIGDTDYKGKLLGDVFPMVRESGILQKFIEVSETGTSANFERWHTGDEMDHWFRFTAVKQGELLVVTTEDITEQKRAENALKDALDAAEKQKRLYASITNNTPDLVYVFDKEYKFSYANKALLTMWGKSAEDAIGKGLRENGYEEWHAQMHEREIDEVVALKKSVRGTVSFPHAELGRRIYDYILVPVFDENGNVEAIAGTTRDITDPKNAEEKLQLSESRLKSMIDQTPAPTLVLMGDDLVITQINKTMLEMIGFGEEVVGIPLLKLMPELKGQYIWNQVENVYKQGVNFDQSEVPVTHKRTGVMHDYFYNIAYRPLEEDGRITGMIQVAIDVTEQVVARKKLEESESRFRALVNASSDVVYSMNPDWSLMRNLEGRDFISDNGEPIRDWIQKHVHPEDQEIVRKEVAGAIAGKRTYELEHRVLKTDGTTAWTFSRAIPIFDENGNAIEWFGSAGDITAQKTITEKLEGLVAERTKELQRSNADLQQFAHVASHDLKEPTRKIKIFASRLEEQLKGKLDDSSSQFLKKIHGATDRMFTMIEGVLAYSTVNAGMQEPEPVDLNEIIQNIETDLEVALQKKGAAISYNNLPTIEGAQVLLYQLFYNLINNSIKFAKADVPLKISITSETAVEEERDLVRITVQDNGIGFEPNEATRIFETFMRLNSKDHYEGTGLGLSLCKKITERHGGSISADGSLGEGATFTISLPVKQYKTGI